VGIGVARRISVLHVCLAGPAVTSNHALVGVLMTRHTVILVGEQARLNELELLGGTDILVLEAGGIRAALPWLLRSLRRRRPELKIVLVDGGLTEHDKADAFSLGVLDYFPSSCRADLLAERLEVLVRTCNAPPSS
jgi:DNA-binding response OmpR family regulator